MSLIVVCVSLSSQTCLAETTDFSTITSLINDHKYDDAERRVDAVLKNEPDNVNALMYKGNIIYFRGSNVGAIQLYGNEDESIYDSSIGEIGDGSSLTSPDVAKSVAAYFKRALAHAPERMDIQFGLCWIYANAGMKDELIARFPDLQKYGRRKANLQYNMGDYARIILDHYSFADGIAVYREIAKLYPDDGNISNDIAAMYLKRGDLDTAMKYFKEAGGKKIHDDSTWTNLALIYAVNGDYDKSAEAQKMASKLGKIQTYLLYDALRKRLHNTPGWEEEVKEFIKKNKGNKEYDEYVAFADSLLPVAGRYTFEQYQSGGQRKVSSNFQIINDEWAVKEFPDRFGAAFTLADMMTYFKNYRRALRLYERIEQAKLAKSADDVDKLNFYYAWALHEAGKVDAANDRWKLLLNSRDFYRKSAASYFLASYHYKKKQYKEAEEYCKPIKDDASSSKYANYCSNMYDSIIKAR